MGSNDFLGCHGYNEFFSTIIPGIGKEVVMWIWGGFTVVGNPTLNKFYSLHYYRLLLLLTGMVFVKIH